MSGWLQELKDGTRAIAQRPAFSALVVGVLGSGLASVIFMLALLNGLVIHPLPFPAPEQLLHAGVRGADSPSIDPLQTADLVEVQRQLARVAQTAGYANSTMNLSDLGRAERYFGAVTSANLFDVLGVAPILGRDFSAADTQAGAPTVAMLSYPLWQSRYASDPAIVGKQIRVVDLGIDTRHLLTARVVLPTTAYAMGADQERLYDRLGDALRSDAGVVDATVATVLPGTWFNDTRGVLPASTPAGDGTLPQTHYGAVDDHFLGAYAITLQQGRFFDQRDTADGIRVGVVDQRFADRYGAGQSVLGRQFRLDPRDPKGATVTVIGVIRSLDLDVPGASALPTLLVPLRQDPFRVASIAVRTRGEPLTFAPQLNAIMHRIDADTPLYWLRDYPQVVGSVTAQSRFLAKNFAILGVIALVLAGAGLYGVMAFAVGQRTREIGVRRALGASRGRVLGDLFARSFVQLGIGLALGLAAGIPFAHLLTRSTQSLPVGNTGVVIAAAGVLVIAALVAVALPARRALRIDPIVALRHE